MALWGFRRRPDPQRDLAQIGTVLGLAIDKFDRDVTKAAARQARQQQKTKRKRLRAPRTQMPWPDMRRPARHRAALPQPLRAQTVPTVLSRQRRLNGAGPASVQAGTARGTATIRNRLRAVRSGLNRLTRRLGGRTR